MKSDWAIENIPFLFSSVYLLDSSWIFQFALYSRGPEGIQDQVIHWSLNISRGIRYESGEKHVTSQPTTPMILEIQSKANPDKILHSIYFSLFLPYLLHFFLFLSNQLVRSVWLWVVSGSASSGLGIRVTTNVLSSDHRPGFITRLVVSIQYWLAYQCTLPVGQVRLALDMVQTIDFRGFASGFHFHFITFHCLALLSLQISAFTS